LKSSQHSSTSSCVELFVGKLLIRCWQLGGPRKGFSTSLIAWFPISLPVMCPQNRVEVMGGLLLAAKQGAEVKEVDHPRCQCDGAHWSRIFQVQEMFHQNSHSKRLPRVPYQTGRDLPCNIVLNLIWPCCKIGVMWVFSRANVWYETAFWYVSSNPGRWPLSHIRRIFGVFAEYLLKAPKRCNCF